MANWRSQHYRDEGLGAGVDEKILDAAAETARAIVRVDAKLQPVFTLRHLAYMAECDYGVLRSIASRSIQNPYRVFRIRKRAGTDGRQRYRTICAPDPELLKVQQWLVKNVLNHGASKVHQASTAFAPKSTLLNAAKPHCGARWLVKVDVQNFFESVSEISAYRAFRSLGYQPLMSFELARLCTRLGSQTARRSHGQWQRKRGIQYSIEAYSNEELNLGRMGHLPQGAPTSPMLANIAMLAADSELELAAKNAGLRYTRYADDLAFSTKEESFTRDCGAAFIRDVYRILGRYGFSPNVAKTQIIPPRARKVVLGLLIDEPVPRLPRDFKEKMRMHLYYLKKEDVGPARHAARRGFVAVAGLRNHVYGLAAYAAQIEPSYGAGLRKSLDEIDWPS